MTCTASSIRACKILPPLSLLAASLLLLQPAQAKQDDRNQPVHVVHADSMDGYNAPNTVSTFTGNVLVVQGTIKMTGELVKVYTAKDDTSIDHVIVTGTPQKRPHVEQIDDDGNLMTGDGDNLYYDNVNGIAILTGNAVVHQQNKGDAYGAKLTYNTNTDQMIGESAPGGIVSMTFLPKQKPLPPPKRLEQVQLPNTTAPSTPNTAKPAAPAPASSAPTKGQP